MKITVVSPFDPFPAAPDHRGAHLGGVERVLREASEGLARRGHDVTVVCSSDGDGATPDAPELRVVREPRVTVLRAPLARLAHHVPADADVVHVPATYPLTTPPVLLRAQRLGVPSVLDLHFEPSPDGIAGRAAAAAYRPVARRLHLLAERVVVRSRRYARTVASLEHVPETRWRVVPNGVDPQRFHPDGDDPGDGLLFVGRLVPYKGVDVLLRALARLDAPPHLTVAGDGPERVSLEALARELGVEVTFLGHVPDGALPDLYRRARATVLPSVNRQEAFGITLLESMACGTPVVASALPGVADVAREGGLVVPARNPAALADALGRALEPGALPRGRRLATGIHARYGWDRIVDRLEAVHEEAAGLAPPREVTLEVQAP